MIDIKLIRADPDYVDAALGKRWKPRVSAKILAIDSNIRKIKSEVQELQSLKNAHAKEMASDRTKASGTFDRQNLATGQYYRDKITVLEDESAKLEKELYNILSALPNLPSDDCIVGKNEDDNLEIKKWGEIPQFDFEPKEHHILGEELGFLSTERGVKIAGTRFSVLTGWLAKLERAIAQFMLDTHTQEFGYHEVSVPFLVNEACAYGTGNLPKFADDLFHTTENMWLIPTAEVSLTNLVREEILDEHDLPLRLTAFTPCFRSEAGSASRDMKGIFRQKQFCKVELVSITTPEKEQEEHLRMTGAAENILQKLNLPYRVVELCTGDMGFASKKTFDIEVWLPGQDKYREVSSCSKCGDFQARRMKARYRPNDSTKIDFLCTLNGSGLAVGRTLIAILENYQQKDGSVVVPKPLVKYLNGTEIITRFDKDLNHPLKWHIGK